MIHITTSLAVSLVVVDVAIWVTVLSLVGAFCFGIVVGWITYRTLRRTSDHSSLSDLATVIGAVGGAAVTALFPLATGAFGAYCIGLALGFFAYLKAARDPDAPLWLGGPPAIGNEHQPPEEQGTQAATGHQIGGRLAPLPPEDKAVQPQPGDQSGPDR